MNRGLMIWGHSVCRSTIALYENLFKCLNLPFRMAVCEMEGANLREAQGFGGKEEFSHLDIVYLNGDYKKCIYQYERNKDCYHFFGAYQKAPLYRKLMSRIVKDGGHYFIGSESPCNMLDGFKRFLKIPYMRFILPLQVKHSICHSDFFINYSGDSSLLAQMIGWPKEKIVPFGYFSPPIIGSKISLERRHLPFHILTSGAISYCRGQDVLLEALCFLKEWGYEFKATITQEGPLKRKLQRIAEAKKLPVEFTGFVSLTKLISLYETCSVYVGPGRDEPWGMRLNDALQCGTPLVVSRGMGGVQLVDRYGCGVSFAREDAIDLATKLAKLMDDKAFYDKCLINAQAAAKAISPENKAKELVNDLRKRSLICE